MRKNLSVIGIAGMLTLLTGCMGTTYSDPGRYTSSYSSRNRSSYGSGYRSRRTSTYRSYKKSGNWDAVSAGPRAGAVWIGEGEARDHLKEELGVSELLSAFGWQFEFQYHIEDTDSIGVVALVPLALGMDQGVFLPSANVLVGLRSDNDWETFVGPNLSPGGVGFCVAMGKAIRVGALSLPINCAVVSGGTGTRVSLTIGGTLEK